jgi:excisionase family DNA binding protein
VAPDGPAIAEAVEKALDDWRDRSTVTIEEAAPIIGVSRGSAYAAAQSGEIPTLRIGRRLVVPVAALRRLLGEMPEASWQPASRGPLGAT